jgi:hypothetical protein
MSGQKALSNQEFLSIKLVHRQLCAVTFLKEYMQFDFDGPLFNYYDFPVAVVDGKEFHREDFGYCDRVCELIGKSVTYIEEIPSDNLTIKFEEGVSICLSLKPEDRSSVEAAMFQAGSQEGWITW